MKVWIKTLDEDVLCPRMDCEIIVKENDIRCKHIDRITVGKRQWT